MKSFDEIFVEMDQIGIIAPVEEADRLCKNMQKIFEIPAEKISGVKAARHNHTIFRGVAQDPAPGVRMDFFDKFPIQLEYLCPIDGDSAWMEYHRKVDRGIHHVRFNVSSHEDAIAYMKQYGIEAYHTADSPRGPGIRFAYFDSYDLLGYLSRQPQIGG